MFDIKERDQVQDLENYQGQWKNVSFLTDGSSHMGNMVHDTQEAAKAVFDAWWANTLNNYEGVRCLCGCKRDYPNELFSYDIQIPFKD